MKISAIKRVCMREQEFVIYEKAAGGQWIGTSSAAYPADGVTLTEGNIASIFDLTQKQCGKISVVSQRMEGSRVCPAERFVVDTLDRMLYGLSVHYEGGVLIPLGYRGQLYFLDELYVRAAECNGKEYRKYFMAENASGAPLVLISDGMLVAGVAEPEPPETARRVQAWLKSACMLTAADWTTPPASDAQIGGQIGMSEAVQDDEDGEAGED